MIKAATKIAIALCMACLPSLSYALDRIEVQPFEAKVLESVIKHDGPFEQVYFDELALSESLSSGKVILHGNDDEHYRVKLQLETSASINAEGPHLDLTDWKHCTTAWQSLAEASENTFLLPDFSTVDIDCFPEFTQDEIKAEVAKQGGDEWLAVLDEDGAASLLEISLSHARIKLEKLIDAQWVVVTVLHIAIPMGC